MERLRLIQRPTSLRGRWSRPLMQNCMKPKKREGIALLPGRFPERVTNLSKVRASALPCLELEYRTERWIYDARPLSPEQRWESSGSDKSSDALALLQLAGAATAEGDHPIGRRHLCIITVLSCVLRHRRYDQNAAILQTRSRFSQPVGKAIDEGSYHRGEPRGGPLPS